MKNLQQGENIGLSQVGLSSSNLFVGIGWINKTNQLIEIDVSAFLLDANGKVTGDNDFIFYNQPEHPTKSVSLNNDPDNGNDVSLFSIRLNSLPKSIHKIVFVVSIDQAIERQQDFHCVSDLCIRVFEPDAFNEKSVLFKVLQVNKETSIALGELYLHQEKWKFRALAKGFESGLGALAQSYGVDLSSDDTQMEVKPSLENNDRFIDQAMAENEIKINKQIKRFLPKIKNAVKQQLNESNTRILLDKVFMDIFGYKVNEVDTEVRIQGKKADYVLSIGDKPVLVVEAKKAGMLLKEEQIFQASSYGAYSGIPYVLLTNLSEFILFKITTQGIVETYPIFSVDLLEDFDIKDIKKLALISRYGMTKPEALETFCIQTLATSTENIARLLVSEEVLEAIRILIKKEQKCDVTHDQIQESIEYFLNVTSAVEGS